MNRKSAAIIGLSLFLAAILLPWLTMLFIPDNAILSAINSRLSPQGLTIKAASIGRPFPFGISAHKLSISDSSSDWVTIDKLSARLNPFYLLLGKISFSISGKVNESLTEGNLTVWPLIKGRLMTEKLELAKIPLLSSATGGKIKGNSRIELSLDQKGAKSPVDGSAKLQIKQIEISGAKIGSLQLPDVAAPELRAVIKLQGQNLTIENLALQGNGIYMRLTGNAPLSSTAMINLNIELMPTAEFLEKQKSLFLIMTPFQSTPGSYRLPVTGTINSPQLAVASTNSK